MAQLGAEVIAVADGYGAAEGAALEAARTSPAAWVSAYNDPAVITGAGTISLEWLAQVPSLDLLLVPVGGGGLVSGVGLAAKALKPDLRVVGVQAENSAALHADFYGGDMTTVPHLPTLADGLAGPVEEGSITVPLVRQVVDEMLLVDEAEIERAMAYAHRAHGQVIEGAGAVGLAALLEGKVTCRGRVVGLLVSGGNVDPEQLERIVRRKT
jgi:threonine dehydratase